MSVRREKSDEARDGNHGALNAAVVVASGKGRSSTHVSSKQRVVQRSGKTRITTERVEQTETEGGIDEHRSRR